MPYVQSFDRNELADYLLPVCRDIAAKRKRKATEQAREEYAQTKAMFHARQIFTLLYQKHLRSWDDMQDLSHAMRQWLHDHLDIFHMDTIAQQRSEDGTTKVLWSLRDHKTVESVVIPAKGQQDTTLAWESEFKGIATDNPVTEEHWNRVTVCVSSQVGCAMACQFCLTGIQGFDRHLGVHEIIAQVAELARQFPLSHVVFMGMGEPLHNLDAIIKSCQILTDDTGLAFSRRKITVSTSGIVPGIDRLRRETGVKLAVSLNGTTDEQRAAIMPINRKWPLESLLEACKRFQEGDDGQSRWMIFEYVMLKDVNDTLEDATRLLALLKDIKAKVNLIPFNPFPGSLLQRSDPAQVVRFKDTLQAGGLFASIRVSRGQDILAACGQLRSANEQTPPLP